MASAAAAAQLASAQTQSLEDGALARNAASVEALMKRQSTDPKDKAYGGYRDDYGLYWPSSGPGMMEHLTAGLLHPRSKYFRSGEVMERLKLAAEASRRGQNEHGNWYLVITNFNSPPDTGFISQTLGVAAFIAKKYEAREILGLIEPILKKAGAALVAGGVHTPNHRWVMSGALAQIHSVFPDPAYVKRIDQWLAEGIDMDADGQWTERSTGVYNPITDRAFVVMADKLKRPELLDPVRRNLDSMLYLLHPGNEIVTEFSTRQDLNTRADMGPYYVSLRYMAVHDKNGKYAALSDHFADRCILSHLMEYPEFARQVAVEPVPSNYEKVFAANRLVRIRRGLTSATISTSGRDRVFFFRRGDAVVNGVRFASAFFGKAQFVPQTGVKRNGVYVLEQNLDAGYYQPFDPPKRIDAENYNSTRSQRTRTEVCHLAQSAEIRELPDGFEVRIRASGTDEVPVAVEINFRDGGKLEGCEKLKLADSWLLPSGVGSYSTDKHRIEFGPGHGEHRYVEVRGALPKLPGPSVYLTGVTPFDRTVRFRLLDKS